MYNLLTKIYSMQTCYLSNLVLLYCTFRRKSVREDENPTKNFVSSIVISRKSEISEKLLTSIYFATLGSSHAFKNTCSIGKADPAVSFLLVSERSDKDIRSKVSLKMLEYQISVKTVGLCSRLQVAGLNRFCRFRSHSIEE